MFPETNIGLVGHVDHGKTSLTQALTGKWTDTHSEEMKRGITIRLGYADAVFYFCKNCKTYTSTKKCAKCFEESEPKRSVSFLDAPGHETLMATVLSGAYLMDGALLLIAANEKCPQPQTAEHLKALDVIGIKNIIIVQNKIDLVSEQQALENYKQIKEFVKGTIAENVPIIPVSAVHNVNIDMLIESIEEKIKTPERNDKEDPRFCVVRSFDVNKPGTLVKDLLGGVIGGSVTNGIFNIGDTVEIRPGVLNNNSYMPLKSKILDIIKSNKHIEKASPGGLTALQLDLDPALTRGDSLSGSVIGIEDKMPPVFTELKMKVELFDFVVGVEHKQKVNPIKIGDPLMLTVAIAKTVGVVTTPGKVLTVKLKSAVCANKGDKVAISMQVGGRWHLIGYGIIE